MYFKFLSVTVAVVTGPLFSAVPTVGDSPSSPNDISVSAYAPNRFTLWDRNNTQGPNAKFIIGWTTNAPSSSPTMVNFTMFNRDVEVLIARIPVRDLYHEVDASRLKGLEAGEYKLEATIDSNPNATSLNSKWFTDTYILF